MGLDITAYSNLHHVGQHDFDPDLNEGEPGPYCYYAGHVQAGAYASFPRSFRGIPVLETRDGFIWGGCYAETEKTETYAFRAGSYSGYGAWRQDLAAQFNPTTLSQDAHGLTMSEPDPELPFYELIWFADNEGCIGPEAARDLLDDFRQHASKYRPRRDDPFHYFTEKYVDWTRAFELAADGGLVDFH